MTEMRLRAANESDAESVEALAAAPSGGQGVPDLRQRLPSGNELFCVALDQDEQLVGFVDGALRSGGEEDEEVEEGATVYIRSVVVKRTGFTVRVLEQYAARLSAKKTQVRRIVADADPDMVGFFVKAAFSATGLAPSKLGNATKLRLVFACKQTRQIPIVQVDAFTSEPFQGNPAAVVLLQPDEFYRESAAIWMQDVAREKNLGATAFTALRQRPGDPNTMSFDIKWFSPAVELAMCGHGTLSAAVALLDGGHVLPTQTVHFYNRTNVLVVHFESAEDKQYRVVMNFPRKRVDTLPVGTPPHAIAQALGIDRVDVVDIQLAMNDIIVHVSRSAFSVLKPDHNRLAEIDTGRFSVTTEAPPNYPADFVSRFFAPRIGINEDHVTGSAHCGLGPYWSAILGKRTLIGYQSSSVRGGFVGIELEESQPDRVLLKCQGVVMAYGSLDALF